MNRFPLALAMAIQVVCCAQQAVRYNTGFFATTVSRGDDATSEPVPLGFNVNFQGRYHSQLFVNTNGSVTFSRPQEAFLPVPLAELRADILAPFYADVDTRAPGTRVVSFGYDLVDGHFAFAANWLEAGYFAQKQDKKNGFQVVIIDRTDTGAGNFDFELNYGYIKWETGDLSGGVDGLGGVSARAGYSSGTATFELPGSGLAGSFLDSSATGLIRRSLNTTVPGRMYFQSRNGVILQSLIQNPSSVSFSLPPRITAFRNLSFSSTGNPIRATLRSDSPWLDVSVREVVSPAAVQVIVTTASMPTGLYLGSITATPDNPMIAPIRVPVTLSIGQPSPVCTYSLNSGSINASPAVGKYAVEVRSQAGCSWRASSGTDWVRILSGAEGGGDGVVEFEVQPNLGVARAATLMVAGKSFAVLQGAASTLSAADSRVCRIETLAGNGDATYYGDEVINSNFVAFQNPLGVAASPSSAIYIADTGNRIIRRFTPGFVRPIQSLRFEPTSIAYDFQGNVYMTDTRANQVYRVTYDGRFELFAGRGDAGYGEPGYSGDQGLALQARLNAPRGIAVANSGVVYIADTGNHVIRAVDRNGVIRTFAGQGIPGFAGDGDYALNARFTSPQGLFFDNKSNLYVADTGNHRIRKISADAFLTTIAGTFEPGFSADGQQALRSRFSGPTGVAADTLGNVYVADKGNHRIRMIRPNGLVFTIAGNGTAGFNGDGIGNLSLLSAPHGISVDGDDRIVVADSGNHRVRRIACAPGFLPPDDQPRISEAINTASLRPVVTTNSYLTLRGRNLSRATANWDNFFPDPRTLPTEVAGVRVRVNGKLAYPYFVSPDTVTVITPEDNVTGTVPVELSNEQGSVFSTVEIAAFAPAAYTSEYQGRTYALAQFEDEFEFVGPEVGATPSGLTTRPAKSGDRIHLFANGLGPVFPFLPEGQPITTEHVVPSITNLKLFLDGKQVTIESATMTSLGLFEVVFVVPDWATSPGDFPIELQAGGATSPVGVLLAVSASQ